MKKQLLLTKVLLIAICLMGGVSSMWGEKQIFTEDFADATYNVTWGGTSAGGISPTVTDGALIVANGSQSGDRSAYIAFGSNANTGCSRLTFDMAMTKSGWSGKNNNFYVLPSATTARYPSTTDAALIVTQDYNGAITIAGESVGTYNATTLTYDLFLNSVTHSATVIVKNGETIIKTITYATTATGINTMHLTFNKNNGAFAIDNISLYSLTAPAFTQSEDSKVVAVGGTETVEVTGITGEVSVVSNNTGVATASYNEGIITIDGVASGVTSLTVTATNDGLSIEKSIEVTVGNVATTNVTVNYLCGETPIASPLVLSDVSVGSTLTASDITYDDVIYGSGARYVNPVPDQTIPYTVVEDGVININYTAQEAVTNVKKIVKAGDATVSSTDVPQDGKYVGDVIYISFPLYINYNGTLYSKSAINSEYKQSFTLTATDQECILNYTATDIKNIVYYSEGEDVTGASVATGGNIPVRSSNAKCGIAPSDITLINLPAGTYKISIVFIAGSSAGYTIPFTLGDESWNAVQPNKDLGGGASNWITKNTVFTFTSAADVKWLTSGDSKNGLDFVYIQQTGVSATVGANGYTTFASPYALDLTDANRPEGLKAYKATLEGTTLSFTALNQKVPAGTGLLLLGETKGGSYDITVVASGDAVDGNDLTGVTADTPMQSNTEGNYIFVMRKASSADSPLTFAPLSTTTEVTVPAGKAYITVPASAFATLSRDLSISFGDETTSIADVRSKMEDVRGDYYNLQGQRVKAPTKGLYIVNGKKVIMK